MPADEAQNTNSQLKDDIYYVTKHQQPAKTVKDDIYYVYEHGFQ